MNPGAFGPNDGMNNPGASGSSARGGNYMDGFGTAGANHNLYGSGLGGSSVASASSLGSGPGTATTGGRFSHSNPQQQQQQHRVLGSSPPVSDFGPSARSNGGLGILGQHHSHSHMQQHQNQHPHPQRQLQQSSGMVAQLSNNMGSNLNFLDSGSNHVNSNHSMQAHVNGGRKGSTPSSSLSQSLSSQRSGASGHPNQNQHAHTSNSSTLSTSSGAVPIPGSHPNIGTGSTATKTATTLTSSSSNFPVKYRISYQKYSNAFTITLIVPKYQQDTHASTSTAIKPKSPFQLVNDGNSNNSTGNSTSNQETHALRIPLQYLVKLSKQQQTSASQQSQTAPWLDRSTLRTRLTDGGKAVGLDPSQIFQSVAAVEESATRVAEWAPEFTDSVDVHVLLADGIVSLVAKVDSNSSSGSISNSGVSDTAIANVSHNQQQLHQNQHQQQQQQRVRNTFPQTAAPSAIDPASSSLHFNYSVLNESSGSSLVATAPSFSGESLSSSYNSASGSAMNTNTTNPTSMNSNNFSSSSSFQPSASMSSSPNDAGIFGSQKGSLSSYDPWSKPLSNPNNTGGSSRMGLFGQPGAAEANRSPSNGNLHPATIQNSDSFMSNDPARGTISSSLNLLSSDHPVNANQLFSSQSSTSTNRSRMDSSKENNVGHHSRDVSGSSGGGSRMNSRPDPAIILEPLLSMGFTRAECEAAIMAIRNLAHRDSSNVINAHSRQTNHLSSPSSRQRSPSMSSINSGARGGHNSQSPAHTQTKSTPQRNNVSGEDILGYVLNNGSNVSAFEQSMADAVAADTFHSSHNHPGQQKVQNMGYSRSNGSTHSQDSSGKSWNSESSSERLPNNGPVWGNAGKLKVVKSSSGNAPANDYPNTMNSAPHPKAGVENTSTIDPNWSAGTDAGPQTQKMVKVLDIPPELNAFVFHCNAQTREECLERGLFGCPSGGQYGPHSKAKKGDLLFLADFSAWTVSGIFTAKTDAGLNLDRSAWNGRFPWQIKVDSWTDLRTVHIDKVNEIIGLASGSKLNMLTKEQLTQLVTSKEFGPCVPPHLFKIKSISQQPSSAGPQMNGENEKYSPMQSVEDLGSQVSMVETKYNLGTHTIKYNKAPASPSNNDEHPATAMHRLKLVTSWFDSLASEIVLMNEVFNKKRSSPKREGQKENKISLDDKVINVIKSCSGQSWPVMSYSLVRRATADIFDQWLLLAHAISSKKDRALSETNDKSSDHGTWTRQQSRSSSSTGRIKEDVVLLQKVPGAASHVQRLFQTTSGTSAMSVPSKLSELLAIKFVSEIEQISSEVRKTQLSLMKIGGDNYMQSIEDKALGMKISEGITKQSGPNQETTERSIVRIEWHTKSSIAQGRPPQVQKLFKTHFDVLEKSYRIRNSADDPQMAHFLTRLFVLLCRYDLVGDVTHRCQTIIPPMAQEAISSQFGVGHDCFSSPLGFGRASFNCSLFADSCKFFGSLGSFFDFDPIEGSFLANPPFNGNALKPMFDHVFRLLQHSDNDKSALSFLIAIRESDPILNNVKRSHFCRRILALENNSKYAVNTLYKDTCSASRKQSKVNVEHGSLLDCTGAWSSSTSSILIWLQNDFGHDVWTPSDEKVGDVVNGFRSPKPNTAIVA